MHKEGRSRWNEGFFSVRRRVGVVSGRCILPVVALAMFLLCLPFTAQASGYLFREIVNGITAPSSFFNRPAINAHGQVTFRGRKWSEELEDNVDRIHKGAVGSLETIIDTSGEFSGLGHYPSINDLGDVAFNGSLATENNEKIMLYTVATEGLTTIAEGYLDDPLARFNSVRGGSVNNNGAVAFNARNEYTDQSYVAVGTGGPPVFIESQYPATTVGQSPMINIAGPTLEVAWRTGDSLGPILIKKGGSLNQTTIAESPSAVLDLIISAPSISNMGVVSFTAVPASGFGEGVYLGNGGTPGLWADTTGEFDDFGPTSISSSELVFYAKLDIGGAGIYTGPNLLTDKVLAEGDTVPGFPSTVEEVYEISTRAVNDNGQIAMRAKFADGTNRVLRADPFDLQQLYETASTVAVFKAEGSSYVSQPIYGSNGSEDLSFDYYFPGSTGQLAVTLGGELLAQIDAPGELVNGFTTFQMPVDIGQLFPDPVDQLLLQFSLSGVGETGVLFLDNIEFGSLVNGDFGTGNLAGWESTFFNDDSVGVAINPFYNAAAAVPEPAALLLALLGLALLPCRRRG